MKKLDKFTKNEKSMMIAFVSLLINAIFCAYHITLGAITHSWWLLAVGAYYVILSMIRFTILRTRTHEERARIFTGVMLTLSALPLLAIVALACTEDHGTQFHKIAMITIAAYAFTKITLASINLFRARRMSSPRLRALRSVSFADALVSIFSLQRSMLVSFEGMDEAGIRMMNFLTGTGVTLAVLLIGILLLRQRKNTENENRS